ncbi:MAG: ABC transporter ATP-binding protein [Candidatus Melainabacteria bacterium]|nr:ABC transporter ATP-binding protein [Candidatus Melainabacteria bacterium]
MIEAKSLDIGWNKNDPVLRGVNLSFKPGMITTIAGPNGSGKSTLLKTLTKLLEPLAGDVLLNDQSIKDLSFAGFARKVAYVPQSKDFSAALTVKQIISLGRNTHQMWWSWQMSQDDTLAVEEALLKTGLTDLQDRDWNCLSGGERQRTLIAVALAQKADYLILDEPVSHLDFKYQLAVADLLKNLKQSGISVIVVLHDLNLIELVSDRIVLLSKEKKMVAKEGTPAEILTEETLAEVFDVKVKITTLDQRRSFHLIGY